MKGMKECRVSAYYHFLLGLLGSTSARHAANASAKQVEAQVRVVCELLVRFDCFWLGFPPYLGSLACFLVYMSRYCIQAYIIYILAFIFRRLTMLEFLSHLGCIPGLCRGLLVTEIKVHRVLFRVCLLLALACLLI